jgi:hypothetical protein
MTCIYYIVAFTSHTLHLGGREVNEVNAVCSGGMKMENIKNV